MWLFGCSGWFLTFPHQKKKISAWGYGSGSSSFFFIFVKYRTGTWHYPSIVHWMRANLNASLLPILGERGLSWQNYWRMSDVLPDDQVLTIWWNITRSNLCEKIKSSIKYTCMNQITKRSKTCIYKIRTFLFHIGFKHTCKLCTGEKRFNYFWICGSNNSNRKLWY